MRVYLLVLDFAFDGAPDTGITAYSTKEKAYAKMLEEFELYKQEYLEIYEEEDLEICEPDDHSASISLVNDWNEKHDSWSIEELEVL